MKIGDFIDDIGNVKFRTAFRDSMYSVLKSKDESGIFNNLGHIFYTAFSIGYHFDKQVEIARKSINHVNLVSLKERDMKELIVVLVLKRKQDIKNPKDLWREVEKYAEYGIQVLFNSWKEKGFIEIDEILESS